MLPGGVDDAQEVEVGDVVLLLGTIGGDLLGRSDSLIVAVVPFQVKESRVSSLESSLEPEVHVQVLLTIFVELLRDNVFGNSDLLLEQYQSVLFCHPTLRVGTEELVALKPEGTLVSSFWGWSLWGDEIRSNVNGFLLRKLSAHFS